MSNICFNWQWKHDWSVSLVGPPTPKSRLSWLLAWKNLCCHNSWRTCYSCTLCPSSSPFKTLDKFIVVTESESIYRWQNIPSFLCLLSIISCTSFDKGIAYIILIGTRGFEVNQPNWTLNSWVLLLYMYTGPKENHSIRAFLIGSKLQIFC